MTDHENGTTRQRASNGASSARRAELLAIAAKLFAERGYAQTTVRDIADEAGILSGSLYHHFDSKEAMLFEIMQEFMNGLHERFQGIVEEELAPGETLDALVRAAFATIDAVPHPVALYQSEASLLARLPDFGFVTRTGRKIERIWIQVLVAGRESGEFRADLESAIIHRFIRDAVWATVRWYNPRGKFPHDKVADQFLAMLRDGLLAS